MKISEKKFGNYNNNEVLEYTISNGNVKLSVSAFGCAITSLEAPGRNGKAHNIVLGFPTLEGYVKDSFYMGSLVGRYAGRINRASFTVGETVYALSQNESSSGAHLHGGSRGFNKKLFKIVSRTVSDDSASLQFHYRSPDGEEGYPGNLDVWFTIELNVGNEVGLRYQAVTDKPTHVNLTNHSYFNLSGSRQSIADHLLYINADSFLETDNHYIPSGVFKPVENTECDFTVPRRIDAFSETRKTGYNDCYIINEHASGSNVAASLSHPGTGIIMGIVTSCPGLILYTGDFLHDPFLKSQALCLEAQHFPDSPNHSNFPTTLLQPGEQYDDVTRLTFTCL